MKIHFFSIFDYILLICVVLLITMGVACIYSSGINSDGISVSNEYIKQIIWAALGLLLLVVFSIYDYRRFQRIYIWLFGVIIVLLVYTRIFGRFVNGAKSWIGIGDFGIQPSEFCKILYILSFARYLEISATDNERKRFFTSLLMLCVPTGLILLQPDLGTASVYIPIFLVMCFMAGIPIRYLMMVLTCGLFTILFTVLPVWQTEIAKVTVPIIKILMNDKLRYLLIMAMGAVTFIGFLGKLFYRNNKYYYWISYCFGIITFSLIASIGAGHVLKAYQLKRLIVYLDPQSDPLGAGWNIIQSKIAIGSGNFWGRGFLHGTQSHYRFLPQQSTDFIFSILSEEFGFLGGIFVFTLYLIIMIRIIKIIRNTSNTYGTYISSGILGMFFFHFVVNVGMVMGIMPITGIPLLFLSYGGSSLWTAMICIGIMMSINYRRLDYTVDYSE